MEKKQIVFTEINKAELLTREVEPLENDSVRVKLAVSTISAGTEKALITGDPNTRIVDAPKVEFPRMSGYSAAGTVSEIGAGVTKVKVGDRVIVSWGTHSSTSTVKERLVTKIPYDDISFAHASFVHIATFPMAAIRKCKLEMGESAMVMGLGILGQFAIRMLHAAGAAPIIAVDPVAKRREEAIKGGADYAFDPFEEGFADKVKAVTGGGVAVAIEVTGQGAGLDETLDCMARFGRVALLGCTRNKDFSIDYYRKVHGPGITLIGAHTNARPIADSAHGWFTEKDDINAIMKMMHFGRLNLDGLTSETNSPSDCFEVYTRLINDREFPLISQFDWSRLE